MTEGRDRSPLELQVGAALRAREAEPGPECPDIEDLLNLAEAGEGSSVGDALRRHVLTCAHCRPLYVEMRRDLWEAAHLHAQAAQRQKPVLGDAWQSAQSWLERLAGQVTQSLDSLRAPSQSFAFSTDEGSSGQQVRFNDQRARGSYFVEGEKRWLHFEHLDWTAGSLILLEAMEPSGEVAWRRFALLSEGWETAEVDVPVVGGQVEQRELRVGRVEPERLTAAASAELTASYQAALTADPSVRSAWQDWAAAIQPLVSETQVRQVVTRILET